MSHNRQAAMERPAKHVKLDNGGGYKFTSAVEIRKSLLTQDQDLIIALTSLRNQLNVKSDEAISPQDERLLLSQDWMELSPGAQDIFEAWEGLNQRQPSLSVLFVSVLASLLVLLSSHYTYQSLGHPIVKTLLLPQWMRRLHSNLSGSHNELILVTLRLLNVISSFAAGRERKSLSETFSWESKSLPKLLLMRRKIKNDAHFDVLARPDIRTLYVQFVLSFVDQETSTMVKSAFLEQHRDVFLSIFKGIAQDPYPIIRKILEVTWAGIWSDQKLKRTLKISLFNESTIFHLTKLYDRFSSESEEADHVPADLVHHFLLAICTRPGVGICFKDRGWYPRDSDGDDSAAVIDDDEPAIRRNGKIYNKILANLLKSLKVNEDLRQQELALKIMTACPELVASYWSGAALTLEPRLSSKWIANVSFFGSVISLPVPSSTFLLPSSVLFQPSPPPLSTMLENILPSVNTKNNMSKGLQSTSALVQHCTALALAKCLAKYVEVLRIFHDVQRVLEEDEDGQWCKRRREIEKEVRRRVPDFQVVIGYSQQKMIDNTVEPGNNHSSDRKNPTKVALLSESAQRLLWLYHRCLPSLVAEAHFDVGKLLLNFIGTTSDGTKVISPEVGSNGIAGLRAIRELHTLRLLKDSDQFAWSGRSPSSPHSYLYILLREYNTTELFATRLAITSLLKETLSDSILFQEDAYEVYLWLDSLPTTRRAQGAEAPDGAMLADERNCVVEFLDDCAQRCLKAAHRYLEQRDTMTLSSTKGVQEENTVLPNDPEIPCSPLLVTVLDQLGKKVSNNLLTPSDVLAITSFIRKLVFKLSTKQHNLDFLWAVTDQVDALVNPGLFPQYPSITTAIRGELAILRSSLGHLRSPPVTPSVSTSAVVEIFLDRVEQVPIPASIPARTVLAYELTDWVRLTDHALHPSEMNRLVSIIERFHPPALKEFYQNLSPSQGSVWGATSVRSAILQGLQFDWLFVSTTPAILEDESNRDSIIDSLFTHSTQLTEIQRAMCLIAHSLTAVGDLHYVQRDLILLAASIVQKCRMTLSPTDFASLNSYIFVQCPGVKALCFSQSLEEPARKALERLIDITFHLPSEDDSKIATEFAVYWMNTVKNNLALQNDTQLALAYPWIKFLETNDLFSLLGFISSYAQVAPGSPALELLETILTALKRTTSNISGTLGQQLPQLLTLRSLLCHSSALEDMIAAAVNTYVPLAHHGYLSDGPGFETSSLETLATLAETQWNHHLDRIPEELDIQTFLTQKSWTSLTARIVSDLLYKQSTSREAYLHWLSTNYKSITTNDLSKSLSAYLDAAIQQEDVIGDAENEILASQFLHLLSYYWTESSHHGSSTYADCLFLIIQRSSSKVSDLLSVLHQHIQSIPNGHTGYQCLLLGRRLRGICHHEIEDIIAYMVDHSLQWAVRIFSGGAEELANAVGFIDDLSDLVKSSSHIKSHLAEPVITVAIQNCLSNASAMRFLTLLVQRAHLKPVSVNRYLQSIVQNPLLFPICVVSDTHDDFSPRDAIVRLILILFNLHPNNTCQPSHVEPLIYIYGGTLSCSDRQLLSIFQLFEKQRRTSVASIIGRWSSSSDSTSPTPLEALRSIDSIRVLRTCLAFPYEISFEAVVDDQKSPYDGQIYDPVFVMLLFGHMFSHSPPDSALAWVDLFRTNVVSLLIRTLSSKNNDVRKIALSQIATLWKCLEKADMQEKPHVLYILALLKDTFPFPMDDSVYRLPSYSSLILLHALRGVFYPSNFIYPLTARFLLQRPELDTNDVPMLYSMLYNSSDDWKKERGWIIQFLSDGLTSADDWRVFKRRHTWDILSSLFQSSDTDFALRNGILQVLAKLTCNSQATTSLVLRSSLLTWIEMQLKTVRYNEIIAWVKIIENIVTVLDPAKLETSTGGEWRPAICRSLLLLLPRHELASTKTVLPFTISVALRLSLLPGLPIPHMPLLIGRLLQLLKSFEKEVILPISHRKERSAVRSWTSPPHGAHGLFESTCNHDPLEVWGDGVEALWRVTMSLESKIPTWDALTCRLLLWRAIVGEDSSAVGEWARREVVRNLRT